MQKRVEFKIKGQKLVGDLHLPDTKPPFPAVIFSHGYKSNRSSEKAQQMGYRFPLEGIAVFRFDHRGALAGESDGQFEDTTLTGRAEDLAAALDYLKTVPEIDSARIGLIGSSLGGSAILALPQDRRVAAIALLSTPITLPAPPSEAREHIQKKGYLEYPDGTRMNKAFFDDLARHDLVEAVRRLKSPLLVIHSDLDELVPRHQAFVLFRNANEPKQLHLIAGGDHAFTNTELLNEVLALVLDWFKKYLL